MLTAVVLAMTLTEWRQDHLNKKQAKKALENIIQETRENRETLVSTLENVSHQLEGLNKALDGYDSLKELSDELSLDINFTTLKTSAMEVAKLNNSLSHLDYETNTYINNLYDMLALYEDWNGQLANLFYQISGANVAEDEKRGIDLLVQYRLRMLLMSGILEAYIRLSEEYLQQWGTHPELPVESEETKTILFDSL